MREQTQKRIYLDHAATTYVRREVKEAMSEYFDVCFANPTGMYQSGRQARAALEDARDAIAGQIGARRREVYFTSGGTESDNWALRGLAGDGHIITTRAEHHAVADTAAALRREGREVTLLPVDRFGAVSAGDVAGALRGDTALVSVIYANNEVGTVNPIAQIGAATRERGVVLHVDAVAAAGQLPLDVQALHADALSLSAHKFYGPKGVGALYVREGVRIGKWMQGGAQQKNLRAGTEDVASAVGMACALALANKNLDENARRLRKLRDLLKERLSALPGVLFTGHPERRLPGHLSMLFPGIKSEILLMRLDKAGVECSAGSSCAAGSLEASHVLLALGVSPADARCALRFTLGESTTAQDVEYTAAALSAIVKSLA